MVTDHFDAPCTPMTKFWIRGASVGFLTTAYCVTQLPTDQAAMVCTAASFGSGLLYPWNAKFSLFTDKLPVKYPMHYVPELLMSALTLGGLYVTMQ